MKIFIDEAGIIYGFDGEDKILFEDHWNVIVRLPSIATDIKTGLRPGIYEVDLPEVERVEQMRPGNNLPWIDMDRPKDEHGIMNYRTVFRFVERKEEKPKQTNMDELPRRIRIDLFTPAELAIYNAQQEVEKAGVDVRLTKASMLLSQAREAVADFVDDIKINEPSDDDILIMSTPTLKARLMEARQEIRGWRVLYSEKQVPPSESQEFIPCGQGENHCNCKSKEECGYIESQEEQSHNFDDLMDFHRQGRSKTTLLKRFTITRKP